MTSSSAFRSRSYKIKEPSGVDDTLRNDESTGGSNKSTCDSPSSTRVSWKTSKIFSRTLSSIEVIRAMKSNKQNNNSNNNSHNQAAAISPTRPSVIVTATGDSATSTTLAPIIKSSSRHHHHENNSYIIKDDSSASSLGHETTSGIVRTRSGNSKAASEWKVLKNKLSSLRKRSTGSSGGGCGGDESSITSISPAPGDESESSGRRLSSNSRTGSARTSRSGSQDEGIVCKREDLINLLTEATKVASSVNPTVTLTSTTSPTLATTSSPFSTSPSSSSSTSTITTTIKPSIIKSDPPSGNVSPTSIGPRKVILKTSSVSSNTVPVTDQQLTDSTRKLVKKSALKKNTSADFNNNNLNSNNHNLNNNSPSVDNSVSTNDSIGFIETRIVVPAKPTLKFDLSHENRHETSKNRSVRGIQFKDHYDNNARNSAELNISVQVTSSPSPIVTTTTTTTTTTDSDVDSDKKVLIEPTDNQDNSESPSSSSVAAVKWDESNVVDAMMLGDAIQAFLKGMEASVQKPTEKRVFFKKQS